MRRYFTPPAAMLAILLGLQTLVYAKPYAPLYPGFPSLEESKAYQQYKLRPAGERSKLLYLIDRFTDSDVKIVYDGEYFEALTAGRIARWFLSRNYKNESAEKWIMRWCNTSILENNLIWVRLPDGRFRLSREILLEELAALNSVSEKDNAASTPISGSISPPGSVDSSLGNGTLNPLAQASAGTATT